MAAECLHCGMPIAAGALECPKCDAVLHEQTDGSVLHRDIAHQHETVAQAMHKLTLALQDCRSSHACGVRLAVGRGVIREEVIRQLSWWVKSGDILHFDHDHGNTGAIMVTLRRVARAPSRGGRQGDARSPDR
ncbi:MAG: hypothetical protein RL572_269 [Pseudomonadota bacterium]